MDDADCILQNTVESFAIVLHRKISNSRWAYSFFSKAKTLESLYLRVDASLAACSGLLLANLLRKGLQFIVLIRDRMQSYYVMDLQVTKMDFICLPLQKP